VGMITFQCAVVTGTSQTACVQILPMFIHLLGIVPAYNKASPTPFIYTLQPVVFTHTNRTAVVNLLAVFTIITQRVLAPPYAGQRGFIEKCQSPTGVRTTSRLGAAAGCAAAGQVRRVRTRGEGHCQQDKRHKPAMHGRGSGDMSGHMLARAILVLVHSQI